MPGVFVHLIAGSAMFFIGRYYFKDYFDGEHKKKEQLLLAVVCLSFSLLPDFFLGLYYTTHVLSFDFLVPFHIFVHFVFTPIAIGVLLILKYVININREPVWVMGLWCVVLHIVMDFFIPEIGWFI